MKRTFLSLLLIFSCSPAWASDFTPLMLMMLVPYVIVGALILLPAWLGTRHVKNIWIKAIVRAVGLALVFTPTYTSGGSGQMLSVALYDLILSAFGDDPVYGEQALINAAVASVVLFIVLVVIYRADSGRG